MKAVDFPEAHLFVAEDQPEYQTLPTYVDRDESGKIICHTFCWQLSWRERLKILIGGKIWHQVLTFGLSLQPQRLYAQRGLMPMSLEQKKQRFEYFEREKARKAAKEAAK